MCIAGWSLVADQRRLVRGDPGRDHEPVEQMTLRRLEAELFEHLAFLDERRRGDVGKPRQGVPGNVALQDEIPGVPVEADDDSQHQGWPSGRERVGEASARPTEDLPEDITDVLGTDRQPCHTVGIDDHADSGDVANQPRHRQLVAAGRGSPGHAARSIGHVSAEIEEVMA